MSEKLKYGTFKEFIERAEELRSLYDIQEDTPSFLLDKYRNYVYSHDYHNRYTEAINNACWDWLLSSCYEYKSLNDLYALLGQVKGGC